MIGAQELQVHLQGLGRLRPGVGAEVALDLDGAVHQQVLHDLGVIDRGDAEHVGAGLDVDAEAAVGGERPVGDRLDEAVAIEGENACP
ncbi:hypothetical protein [Nannocystis pusilla]|uniref:hypothetical protein n=1 Tax=Nannocystis pusilla TaxID=889268 RepID=UPI003B7B525F